MLALYTTLVLRQLFPTGHEALSLQLQAFSSLASASSFFFNIFMLCALTMLSILGIHE